MLMIKNEVEQGMPKINEQRPSSPCIGACSTSFGSDWCVGCGRHYLEVVEWNYLSEERKEAIWLRITEEGTAIRFRNNGKI